MLLLALKMEKLNESVVQLKQGKEAAEKQIKLMSSQMVTSMENYRRGFDEILERNQTEFEDAKKKLQEGKDQLQKQACETNASMFFSYTVLMVFMNA